MAETPQSIQKIKIGSDEHPIDAISVGGKTISQIGELVTEISSSSTDTQYPSAKCMWNVLGDIETRLSNI